MSIIAWIALGLVSGSIVGWLAGGRGRLLLGDIAVATVGAVLGGFVAAVTLGLDIADIDTTSLLMAAVGAAVLLLILHALPTTQVFD
jgi:uncharacterized membrane protein YeaQ/YmgE (transglycosylase-associated protein family)